MYVEVPLGFGSDLAIEKIYKPKKGLYGLKQSPRAWFRRFAIVIKKVRCRQSQGNHMLFIKHLDLGEVTTLLVYV